MVNYNIDGLIKANNKKSDDVKDRFLSLINSMGYNIKSDYNYRKNVLICDKDEIRYSVCPSRVLYNNGFKEKLVCVDKEKYYIREFMKIFGDLYKYNDFVFKGEITKIDIVCHKHGVFSKRISRHLKGEGCPECTKEKQLKQSADKFYSYCEKVSLKIISGEYKGNTSVFDIEDVEGFKYQQTAQNILARDSSNFTKVTSKGKYSIHNINMILKLRGSHLRAKIDQEFINNRLPIVFICDCEEKNEVLASWSSVTSESVKQCRGCVAKNIRKRCGNAQDEVEYIFKKMGYVYPKGYNYQNNVTYITFYDNDGYKFYAPFYAVKNGQEIERFRPNNPYVIHNIKNYLKINNIKTELLSDNFVKASATLDWKCECGRKFPASWNLFYSMRKTICHSCASRDSKYEKATIDILECFNFEYNKEESIRLYSDRNRNLRLDFYLPKYRISIECDGKHHYEPVNYGGMSDEDAKKLFETTKKRDFAKDNYCKENNIPLLRIPYWEFKKNGSYKQIILDFIEENKHRYEKFEEEI